MGLPPLPLLPRPVLLAGLLCLGLRASTPALAGPKKDPMIKFPGEDEEMTIPASEVRERIRERRKTMAQWKMQYERGRSCHDNPRANIAACAALLGEAPRPEQLAAEKIDDLKDTVRRVMDGKLESIEEDKRRIRLDEDALRGAGVAIEESSNAGDTTAPGERNTTFEDPGADGRVNPDPRGEDHSGDKEPRHRGRAVDPLSGGRSGRDGRGASSSEQVVKGAMGDRERAAASRGVQSAKTLADGMKRSLDITENFDGGSRGAAAMGGARPRMGGAGAAAFGAAGAGGAGAASSGSGDPSRPASDQDLLLAAGPYRDVYQRLGLQAVTGPDGRPRIQRLDGSPSSESDRARLALEIRREPSALMRDPDYFNPSRGGIARDDFYALKETYRTATDRRDTDFKHIELSPPEEERDFTFSEPCDAVSLDCNPHLETDYSKGADVPARGLKKISESARGNLAAGGAREKGLAQPSPGGKQGRLSSRISSLLSGLMSRDQWGAPGGGEDAGGPLAGPRTGRGDSAPGERFLTSARPGAQQAAGDGTPREPAQAANARLASSAMPERRVLFPLLLSATALLLLFLLAARRRDEP